MSKKIYDYDSGRVRAKLKEGFRRRAREATLADLVAETALPRIQVEEQLPAVADEYDARLRVTESGEVLYSFPRGMHSRYRGIGPSLKRFLAKAGKAARTVLAYLFKAWIVLMLVGYFVFFLALLVLFVVGGIAAQSSGRGSSRRSSSGGAGLVGSLLNLFVRIWFYSEFLKGPERRSPRSVSEPRRPLHKAVFSFVFGDGDPNSSWPEVERKAVLAYLRGHSGLISLEEFMILTGRPPEDAARAINAYCLEFEGSPEASPEGIVYYRFDSIMRSADAARPSDPSAPAKRPIAFSSNPRSANAWFAAMNGVNFAFGGFFLAGAALWGEGALRALEAGSRLLRSDIPRYFYAFVLALFSGAFADPVGAVSIILGIVPIAFASLFYVVPALRALSLKRRNALIRKENLRRVVYGRAWADPEAGISPAEAGASASPGDAEKLLDELASYSAARIDAGPGGALRYAFPELKRARESMASLRRGIDKSSFALGKEVFDTE